MYLKDFGGYKVITMSMDYQKILMIQDLLVVDLVVENVHWLEVERQLLG
jgi:hypothetical protein